MQTDRTALPVNTQASEKSSGVPLADIMKELYQAASSDSERPDHNPSTKLLPINLKLSARVRAIQDSLNRAYRKSVVRAVKPFRRLLRNQGAVNDSMLQAMFELSAETQEMIEDMTELQLRLNALEAQVKQLRAKTGEPDAASKAE